MIITPRIGLRVAAIVLLAVVLQVSFFSYLSLLGVTPDMLAIVIICLGLLGGGVIGGVCGFAAGILLDSILLQTLGVSSLVLLAAGYLAGRYREGFEISGRWVAPLLAGGLTALAALGFAGIQLMLGVETHVSLLVVREIVVKGMLAFLFALPVYAVLRRLLRPGLVDAGAPLRRRPPPRRSRPRRRGGPARMGGVPARRVRGGLA